MQENWHNHIFGTLGPPSSPGAFTSSKQQIISFSLSAKAQCFVILSRCWCHTSCQKEQCETHSPLKYNLLWGKWQGNRSHCGHGLKVGASLRTSNDCGIELVRTVFLTWIFLRGNEIIGVLRCQNETRVLKSSCFIKNVIVILQLEVSTQQRDKIAAALKPGHQAKKCPIWLLQSKPKAPASQE